MTDQRKKLNPADWATIVTAYSRGEKTVRDLADEFKVTPQAIHQGLRQRGIVKAGRIAEVQAEVKDAATAARKQKVQDAHKKAEDYSKRIDLIVQLTVKKIVDANKEGTLAAANGDVITLKNAIATIAKGREEHWDIHKVDQLMQEDEELAVLNVGEYTEDELETIRAANEESYLETLDDVEGLGNDEFDLDTDTDDEDGSAA